MLKKLLFLTLVTLSIPALAVAQGSITGVITDAATGETLPGANVIITELSMGVSANVDGEYTLRNVPVGTYTLTVSFVSFKKQEQSVTVGSSELVLDVSLEPDYFGLEEVVVTGVGQGTQTTKLGFSVGKINQETLEEVPAVDVGNALRGKIAGVTIVQASGNPASAPDIRLRGSNSISGGQNPLIIIDGVITSGNLRDINMTDVESIEVVKGAAAASLYGSLAGNGVIQIITKRNASQVNQPEVTIRSEFGYSEIAEDYPSATKHPYVNDYTLTNDGVTADPNGKYILTWPAAGSGTYDADRKFDNDFPVLYDNIDAIFTNNPYQNHNFALASSSQNYNYRVSFDNFRQGGVLEPLDDYVRNTARFNADFVPNEDFTASVNVAFTQVEAPNVSEQGQGSNYFYSVLTAEPVIDFQQKDANGNITNDLFGYSALGSNFQNPLYVADQRETSFERDRIIAGASFKYNLMDNLSVNGRQSFDRSYANAQTFYPKGYITPNPSTLILGSDSRSVSESKTSISELWFQYNESFEDFNVSSQIKYLYEDRTSESVSLSGTNYPVPGIRSIGATDAASQSIGSSSQTVRAENYFLSVDVDYLDKIIVGGLIRRDGSSGFGSQERWQTYYRGSLAYRITEDFEINNINEWKVRVSYGTSGQRPPFVAQYETFNASGSGISPGRLGNNEIKPSTVAELEFGTNITFLNKFNFEANYALTNVENDYIVVPLSSVAGFSSQYQNVGEIESSALEFALNGQLLDKRDLSWSSTVTWAKITQEVTSLGGTPAFTRSAGGALPLFRFEANVPYGTMYGNKALTSLSQLTVVGGEVLNAGVDVDASGTLTAADFEVNRHGYVVPKGTHGTAAEQITYMVNEDGTKAVTTIGNTNPDFNLGFSNTLNYKGIGLYLLVDWVQGGEVYNYTKQLLYFNNRHKDAQDFATQGFDTGYTDGGSAAYNAAQASSYFVEDASFVKLREVALSYTLSQKKLGKVGDYVKQVKLSVTGRNLLTFTNYTGWDPEVALSTNSTNFRLDEYAYPNYRTFTGAIQVRF